MQNTKLQKDENVAKKMNNEKLQMVEKAIYYYEEFFSVLFFIFFQFKKNFYN